MELRMLTDARHFAEVASPWLASDPFSTNVIGVQLGGVLAGNRVQGEGDIWIAAIEGGKVVGAAMHTPPYSLFLPRLPAGIPSEIALALSGEGRALRGVNGETAAVAEFVGTWAQCTGAGSSLRRATRMYRLEELRYPVGTAGDARLASEGDRELVGEWLVRFHSEATQGEPLDVAAVVDRRLAGQEVWLWCAGGSPVALAAHSAPSGGVARVGPVYTPPTDRGRGYGSAVTARVTLAALQAGANDVVLYTDLANPTSNAIYQAIGYVPDHDAQERSLTAGT
jgi:RimJ/RimL family protein N-acetyltransferase